LQDKGMRPPIIPQINALHGNFAVCALVVAAMFAMSGSRVLFAAVPDPVPAVALQPDPRQAALADYLSDKYRARRDATERAVAEAHRTGELVDVDPLLILAVVAVESRFDPAARSGFGAKGLMQVVPKFHREKLAEHGGEPAIFDPAVNVRVGTQILKEYVRRTGSVRAGLQRYAGWQDDPEHRYARKVLAEKQRLRAVVNRSSGDHHEKTS
jgi:soluble lytic murein transglycosylase-like protein